MQAADDRVSIRPLQDDAADYALLARWLSDARVLEFYEGRDHPFSLTDVMKKFSPRVLNADGVQACLIFAADVPVGYLQYEQLHPDDLREYSLPLDQTAYGLDLFIGEAELWGQGLGRRAVKLASDWLFAHRQADCVTLDPHADNERAIRSYATCGFERIRLLPKHELHEGRWLDCWLMIKRAG